MEKTDAQKLRQEFIAVSRELAFNVDAMQNAYCAFMTIAQVEDFWNRLDELSCDTGKDRQSFVQPYAVYEMTYGERSDSMSKYDQATKYYEDMLPRRKAALAEIFEMDAKLSQVVEDHFTNQERDGFGIMRKYDLTLFKETREMHGWAPSN